MSLESTAQITPMEVHASEAAATHMPHEGAIRRHLRPVLSPSRQQRRSPLFLAMTCVLIVLAILAIQLWLSIAISRGAYEASALVVEQRELSRAEQVLQQDVDKLASPQHLAEEAIELGMVQNSHPAYLNLAESAVLGSLTSNTSDARENLIPNEALAAMSSEPATGERAQGEESGTDVKEDVVPQTSASSEPLPWEGDLPVPVTH